MQKGSALVFLIVGILIVALVGTGAFLLGRKSVTQTVPTSSDSPTTVACTMDAKLCPDGTSVGRVGPKCEFAKCATVAAETANWETYKNEKQNYTINYPQGFRLYPEEISNGRSIVSIDDPTYEGGQNIWIWAINDLTNEIDFIKNHIFPYSNPNKIGEVTISNMVGEKWSFNKNPEDDNYVIILRKGNKVYLLEKELSNKNKFEKYSAEIDSILRTFKFTN